MEPIICPYLGLSNDPTTSTAFPYAGNLCHQVKPPAAVSLIHQRNYCLTSAHTGCPGYKNGWRNGFPKELRAGGKQWWKIFQKKWVWVIVAILLLAALWFSFPQQLQAMGRQLLDKVGGWLNPPTSATPMWPTGTITPTSTIEPTIFTNTPTERPTRTITNTKTATSTSTTTEIPYFTLTSTRVFYVAPTNTQRPANTAVPPTATPQPQPTRPRPTQPPPTQPPPTQPPPTQPPPTKTPDVKPSPTNTKVFKLSPTSTPTN